MIIKLKPLSHPEFGELAIEDRLFPIGRSQAPFDHYDQSVVAHLSRRHARIFVEDQNPYIADLGSRNGTRLNGKKVEFKPARLLHGDRLTLAGHIDYDVEIEAGEPALDEPGGYLLNLTPAGDEAAPLEAIKISRFPYLIGKSEPGQANGSAYLSRRHAHIFSSKGKLFLEDLGSTNGSFINSERLQEYAREIHDGDLLSFGGDQLCYRAELRSISDAPRQPGDPATGEPVAVDAADGAGTVMVSSASSFLDIFCVEEEKPEVQAEDTNENEPEAKDSGSGQRPGRLQKIRTFGQELQGAFAGEPRDKRDNRRRTGIAAAAIVLLGAAALAVYYSGKPLRDLEALAAQEHHLDAATMAAEMLVDDPDNQAVEKLATEALARHMVTSWLPLDREGEFEQAEQLLSGIRPLARPDSVSAELIDMMDWVTSMQQFVTERGGMQAPLRMYRDEDTIRELLAWWNLDQRGHRGRMNLLLNYAPEFKEPHDRTFSQLRSLRNEQSVYLGAIDKLNNNIDEKLATDRAGELAEELTSFARQYPQVAGVDVLQADLQRYLQVRNAMATQDVLQATRILENTRFLTPPFLAQTARIQATLLPSPELASQYLEASRAWRAGELSRATSILTALASQQGGDLATRELEIKRKIISDYARLQQLRDQPGFGDHLVRFYSALDPQEDLLFSHSLEQEFQRHRETALQRADEAWQQADSNWVSYRQDGGIRGLMRLEENVSSRFTQQAALLAGAATSASYASGIYQLLDLPIPGNRDTLLNQVEAEMNLQRRSLEELSMVLSPEVLATKLNVLTGIAAVEQLPTE